MIVRLGFLVAASVAAYAVKHVNVKGPRPSAKSSEKEDEACDVQAFDEEVKEQFIYSTDGAKEVAQDEDEEEEKEEVKLINGIINPPSRNLSDIEDEISEFESLFSGEIDFPLPGDKYDKALELKAERERMYEKEMAINANELDRLQSLVQELQEREVKLEGELLEYYGLKEQESDVVELQRQLKIKTVELDLLNATINSLQTERKKLQEEVTRGAAVRKDLEFARNKIKELQRQIQLDANQTKGQLLLLKQQVTSLQSKEQDAYKNDSEIERKLKALKRLEVEVMELKRMNKELQHEKRDLVVKLDASQTKLSALSNITESEMVANVREEVNSLRHANDDLQKQVEGLQMNRFSEVEELVYLRWVNACLRFELRNYQMPEGKVTARDLSKSLSPRSQAKAKQLMLEYAGSERGQGDTDVESNFSHPSSPGSEDFDNTSIDSSISKYSSLSKKASLMQKLKRWGRSRDDSSVLSSPARSFGGASPSRSSISARPRGPLEALMLRNTGDDVAITSFGMADQDIPGSPQTPRPQNDPLNSITSSFQLMSKSVEGVMTEKYPAYKDRHKLSLEREKNIKQKAEQARIVKFSDASGLKPGKSIALPPKLSLIKEKGNTPADLTDPSNEGSVDYQTVTKMKLAQVEKRVPRVPRPPPKLSVGAPGSSSTNNSKGPAGAPPPPPPPPGAPLPPPPPGGPPRPPPPPGAIKAGGGGEKVHRAPEVVEFYQSLMKREAKRDTSPLISSNSNVSDAKSNMIGEIANKSSFLLAVKADVETQGDFVQSLATEVRGASFTNVEDLAAFVNWLDEELSFLVDERAVLKHFDWPESKADALREAAFEYQDIVKLEKQVTSYLDDPSLPCETALKKMYRLLEKVEQSVYALLRTRDMAISRYKEFGIPVDWMLDSGLIGKIKLSSVQLARAYMKRVASELDALSGPEKEPNREFLVLQGVRFAFRVHQFAGGFDSESMKAFEELRARVRSQTGEENNQETS